MKWEFGYTLEELQELFDKKVNYISKNARVITLSSLRKKRRRIAEWVVDYVLRTYKTHHLPLAIRQIHYAAASAEIGYKNNEKDYRWLKSFSVQARYSKLIPFYAITDPDAYIGDWGLLGLSYKEAFMSVKDVLQQRVCIDPWDQMKKKLIIITEKRELFPQLQRVCSEYHVRLVCPKGEASWSVLANEAKLIRNYLNRGYVVKVFFVTDHDPTGLEIQRFITAVFKNYFRLNSELYGENIEYRRIMLTFQQAASLNLLPMPTKPKDPRAKHYRKVFGGLCWEVDALGIRGLQTVLKENILREIDKKVWRKTMKWNMKRKKEIEEIIAKIQHPQ